MDPLSMSYQNMSYSVPNQRSYTPTLFRPLVHLYLISAAPNPSLLQYANEIIRELTEMGADVAYFESFQQIRLKMEKIPEILKRSQFQSHIILKDTFELTKDISCFINDKETKIKFLRKKSEILNILSRYFHPIQLPIFNNHNFDLILKNLTTFTVESIYSTIHGPGPVILDTLVGCLSRCQTMLIRIRNIPELTPGRKVELHNRPDFKDTPQIVFEPNLKKQLMLYIEKCYSAVEYMLANKQLYPCNNCGRIINPSIGMCVYCRDQLVQNVQYDYPPYSPLSQYPEPSSPPPLVELNVEKNLNPNAKPFIPKRYSTPNKANNTYNYQDQFKHFEHPCKLCGKEGKLQCKECPHIPPFLHTYYCSIECQRKDWSDHQKQHNRF